MTTCIRHAVPISILLWELLLIAGLEVWRMVL